VPGEGAHLVLDEADVLDDLVRDPGDDLLDPVGRQAE